jgi:hypothetical protein
MKRFVEKTPKGLKQVRNIALIVASVAGALVATAATGGVALPAGLVTVCAVLSAVAGGVAGGAQAGKSGEE